MTALPATPASASARPLGEPPFGTVGEAFMGRYRNPGWTPGRPEHIFPMRLVEDGPRGLVGWLASGTPRLELRDPDGSGPRDVPLEHRFRPQRWAHAVTARVQWEGPGVLRIAPTGRPWNVLVFWSQDADGERAFAGWYVNLENPAQREGLDLVSTDHVLDVWIDPNGSVQWKDEDELAAAVEQGRYTSTQAATIREAGDDALGEFSRGHWAFDPAWTTWRAAAGWSLPLLPDGTRWTWDLLDTDGERSAPPVTSGP